MGGALENPNKPSLVRNNLRFKVLNSVNVVLPMMKHKSVEKFKTFRIYGTQIRNKNETLHRNMTHFTKNWKNYGNTIFSTLRIMINH